MSVAHHLRRRIEPVAAAARYRRSGPDSIRYLGWLGQRNLGDEAVYEAIQRHFAPRPLAWRPEEVPARLGSLAGERPHALTLLGGGTLIGGRYLDDLMAEPRAARRAVFGAGVIDPDFPHSYRHGRDALDRWADALQHVGLLGVRGPRSQELLAERGVVAPILGDPAACFVRPDGHWEPGAARTIGINVGHSGGAVWGSELSMLATLADFVRALRNCGWQVEYYVVWPADLPVTRMVMNDTGTRDAAVHTVYDHADDFVARVRHVHAFVGVKLHAVALAACAGVPTAAIEYHPKCRDFMASIDLDRLALRADRLSVAELLEVVGELVGDGPVVAKTARECLVRFRDQQRAAAQDLIARIG